MKMNRRWKKTWLVMASLLLANVGFTPSSDGAPTRPGESASPRVAAPCEVPAGSAILTGVVVAESGRSMALASVAAFAYLDADSVRELRAGGGDWLPQPLVSCPTGDDGRFRMPVPPATRVVVVAAGRVATARARLTRSILTPDTGRERDLGEIELAPGREILGRVLDPGGAPVAGARVMASVDPGPGRRPAGALMRRLADSGTLPYPAVTQTAADGSFRLAGVPQEAVTVRAMAPGFAVTRVEAVRVPALSIRLVSGRQVRGQVVAPDGKTPVAGAWVEAGPHGLEGVARADDGGAFVLPDLAAGVRSLVALPPVSVMQPGQPEAHSPASLYASSGYVAVNLPAATDAAVSEPILKLRQGGTVQVKAIDAETRKPVPGTFITLDVPGERRPRTAAVGATGELLFVGVPAGTIRGDATADSYLEENLGNTPVRAGEGRTWSAALQPAAAVEGTVRDPEGRPVAGVSISVGGPPPFSLPVRLPLTFPVGVDPVESDSRGRFRMEGLPPRKELKFSAASAGYVPWEAEGFVLQPRERRTGMEVLLESGGAITGRIVNADGRPVPMAMVTATRRPESSGGVMIRLQARTRRGGRRAGIGGPEQTLESVFSDADGLFRIDGTRPGIWSLDVEAATYAAHEVPGLKLAEKGEVLDAGDISLEPGARIQGVVLDEAGEPLPYVQGMITKGAFGGPVAEFASAADGRFTSGDLVAGEAVTLRLDAEGYGAVEKEGLAPPVDDLQITLKPASRVRGTVIDQSTRRAITDFSIGVARDRSAGGGGMRMVSNVRGPETPFQSDDGTFEMDDVDPGQVAVTARAPGYRESTMRELEVPEGEDLDGLVFELDRAASVSGFVTDEPGTPLSGVTVEKKEASGGMMRLNMGGGGRITTDGEGQFVIDGLERGPLTLSFTHSDHEPQDLDIDTTEDITGLTVRLSAGAVLTGLVLREEDGSPVRGATVSAVEAGSSRFSGGRSATSSTDGTFVLEGISAGRYSLRAEAEGLTPGVVDDVVVESGAAPAPLELRLGGGVVLTGQVTGLRSENPGDFNVRAVKSGGNGFGVSVPVDAEGGFEMSGLSPGSFTVIASSGFLGGRSASTAVEIPEGVAVWEATIELPAGSTVEGMVRRGEAAVSGATVIFSHQGSRASATGTTDASGSYTIQDLESGEYDVSVLQMSSGLSYQTSTQVATDERFDIVIPQARILGFVLDAASGRPLEGVSIASDREGEAPATAGGGPRLMLGQGGRSDATGYFSVGDLDEGTWTLTASKDGYGFEVQSVMIGPEGGDREVMFELRPTDSLAFRAIDATSGISLGSLTALVLVPGGGDPLSPMGTGSRVISQATLAADGSGMFRLDSLQPGTYRLVLGGAGVATETLDNVSFPGPEQTVTMGAAGMVEVRATDLSPGETARAVLLRPDGGPVHTGTFFAEPVFTVRAGSPTTLASVKPGSYTLRMELPDGSRVDRPVVVAPGTAASIAVP